VTPHRPHRSHPPAPLPERPVRPSADPALTWEFNRTAGVAPVRGRAMGNWSNGAHPHGGRA